MEELRFDEKEHKYWIGDTHVPNVTSILNPISAYRNIDPAKMETARKKGVAIHKMVELDCKGKLDKVPEWMEPAYYEWVRWRQLTQFEIIQSEAKLYHPIYKYAGTQDLYGSIVVRKGHKEARMEVDIDIKRSFLGGKTIGYQIAAYQEARRANYTKIPTSICKRFALVIREDSKFKMKEYDNPRDFQNFLTCLNWQRLKELHNA